MASKAPWQLSCLLAFIALAGAGCGEDDPKCVATVCDPATFGQVCLGHAVQSCAADGERFVYTACGAQQRCEASGASASCVARTCTTLGQSKCVSVTDIERCKDDGSGVETISCGTAETCKDGACIPNECADSDPDHCSNNGFLTCTNADWVQNNCPVGNLCTLQDNGVARCNPTVCTPEARRCDGASVRVCDARGAVETTIACKGDEVCIDGFCQAEVCGATTPDASDVSETTDTIETETVEPESKIVFTLNGVANTFDISAFATFDAGERQVTVKASKSTKQLELRFKPANMTIAGSFSSEIFNPVKVVVCYDTGGSVASFDDCVGFTHRSVAYDVVVTKNEGQGGRFEATFSATLEDQNTDTITLSAGQINVKYR